MVIVPLAMVIACNRKPVATLERKKDIETKLIWVRIIAHDLVIDLHCRDKPASAIAMVYSCGETSYRIPNR